MGYQVVYIGWMSPLRRQVMKVDLGQTVPMREDCAVAWSTRELADLAGTTVNTVRHYHSLGLLDPPDRKYNGYKQYQVHHLVHLLRVRRLVELGVPLSRVGAVAGGVASTRTELSQVDAELRTNIERMQRARSDIATIQRESAPPDTPREFESVGSRLSAADRSLVHLLTRLHSRDALSRLREVVGAEHEALGQAFNTLQPDAADATRQGIADRIADGRTNWRSPDHPWLADSTGLARTNDAVIRLIHAEALIELYNGAQRDVLRRAGMSEASSTRLLPTVSAAPAPTQFPVTISTGSPGVARSAVLEDCVR